MKAAGAVGWQNVTGGDSDSMKIAITNPTDWPHVRRGAERFINELAAYLTKRGHQVTVISAHPARTKRSFDRGYETIHFRRWWHPAMRKLGILEFHSFFFTALRALLGRRFDVVQCCTFMDAYAAEWSRTITRVPCAFLINGIPPKAKYYRTLTMKGAIFRQAVLKADEVISISQYMHEYFMDRFGRGGIILPIPVDLDRFPLQRMRDHSRPIVLCAASLDDARKGGRLLARAFDRLKERQKGAQLQVVGSASVATQSVMLDLIRPEFRSDVEFLDPNQADKLAEWYGRASISVLPSLWEAFGMVVIESLATGTPVVATRDGALPELVNDDRIGRLFDPGETVGAEASNVEGLVQAMLEGIELSRDPQTAPACRERASQYSWSTIGPRFEEIYDRLSSRCSSASSRAIT